MERFAAFEGRLHEGPGVLLAALDALFELRRLMHRLHTYASLEADEDLRRSGPQGRRQQIEAAWAEIAGRIAWFDPEVLSLPATKIERALREEPRLETYRRTLESIERHRPHTLSPSEEVLLGQARLMAGAGETVASLLRNAEIPWPELERRDGSRVRIDATGYSQMRVSPERSEREASFEAFHGTLQSFRQSLAAGVYATVKEHVFESRARRYASSLEAALDQNEVDVSVYHMLLAEVNAALPSLHRYLRLRKRILDLDELRYHDLYAPLSPSLDTRFPWDESCEIVVDAIAPLGRDYAGALQDALAKRWVDVDPRPGKRAGAYVNDGAYGVHPYMLLNHQDDLHSLSTLAHEAGHMMHSRLSQATQPYPTARYVIFVAEVASTLNEALLLRTLLDRADSDTERLAFLGHHLDNIRGTVFRQTMFAELELKMHEAVEKGEALTGDTLNELYHELLRRYHGAAEGVMPIEELYAAEWAFIAHFHLNFYVYQYATSFVAATALARRILDGEADTLARYKRFLSAGSSAPPLELLAEAGVDMRRPDAIRDTVTEMEETMDAIEEILERC